MGSLTARQCLSEKLFNLTYPQVTRYDHEGVLCSPFRERLASLHASEPQPGFDGRLHQVDGTTRISPQEGMALVSLAVEVGATRTLEIGLGYGFSTAYLLAALASMQQPASVRHVAVDPYQGTDWMGIGVTNAQSLVTASASLSGEAFRLIEERSDVALARLLDDGHDFDLTFIDGYHRFDDVLVDFTFVAQMCPIGGVIVLHDMWLPGIAAVAAFIRANRRDFEPVDTGCGNLFAVRRTGGDNRNWDHYVPFDAGRSHPS